MSAQAPASNLQPGGFDWLAQYMPTLVPGARALTAMQRAQLGTQLAAELRAGQLDERAAPAHERAALAQLCDAVELAAPAWTSEADATALPLLALLPEIGTAVIYAEAGSSEWLLQTALGPQRISRTLDGAVFAPLRLKVAEAAATSARQLFGRVLKAQRPAFATAALASLLANVVALAGSMYSMQVYDRVIPTQGLSTLTVLTIGALLACVFEMVIKLARSAILESAVQRMDQQLSHTIFQRLLSLRIDQLPASVGSLSSQVRSYESIRAFATTATMYVVVDAPFGLLFLGVMLMLAGPTLVTVPAVFFIVALVAGGLFRARIAAHAGSASAAGNRKAGLLVETIENAENIKAAGTGWTQAAKWNTLSRQSIEDELKIKHYSETAAYFAGFVQQASYIVMIGVGAWIAATSSELTTGGLIACSILSGRVLGPIGMLPGLVVQWAHARIALDNLERIFTLEQDNHGVARPLVPQALAGTFRIEDLKFAYPNQPPTVALQRLHIAAGEKLAILGPVGAGKSTLLKVMAGLYKPQQGRVLVDGLDIQQIAREHLSAQVGYLSQEVRLVAGTLRENLGGGLPGVSDEAIIAACRSTGLIALVAGHQKGLDLEIGEGGSGVSGGQRRLIGLTRLVLARPSVWLLDEPTSSLDEMTERQSMTLLQHAMKPGQTVVLVTHKPQMLALVNRVVVLTRDGIAMDGPRDQVLAALNQNARQPQAAQQAPQAQPQQQAQPAPAARVAVPLTLNASTLTSSLRPTGATA